jgi:hypothetical protein
VLPLLENAGELRLLLIAQIKTIGTYLLYLSF